MKSIKIIFLKNYKYKKKKKKEKITCSRKKKYKKILEQTSVFVRKIASICFLMCASAAK
jgi:hypothetical protein